METLLHSDGFIDWPGIRQLITNAHQLTDQPDIALQTGLRALPAMHGPMGMAAMASPTLRDAMQQAWVQWLYESAQLNDWLNQLANE